MPLPHRPEFRQRAVELEREPAKPIAPIDDATAECAAAGHDLDPHYVMARLADLTIKRLADAPTA